jgi:hypothetical protein
MRTLDLLSLAVEAEALRLRRELATVARSAAWGFAGAGFAAAAAVMLHVAAWYWLLPHLGFPGSALLIATVDVVLAGILLLISRPGRDPIAEEAGRLRAMSLQATRDVNPLADLFGSGRGHTPAGAIAGVLADAAVAVMRRK